MGKLFLPIKIDSHEVRNRVVLPPVVRFGWGGEDGRVTGQHIAHYRECAEGGAGLVIVEATCVTAKGRSFPGQLGLWEDGQIPGFARIAEAVHGAGSTVLVQLHHGGYTSIHGDAVCPSELHDDKRNARAMTAEELRDIQDAFAAAAHRASKAGLDGVELHGAHGYLLSQFASPGVNRREDAYGGSVENRARFAVEIIARIKKQLPADFVIAIRMGGNEPTVAEGIELAGLYQDAGADILDVSTGMGPSPEAPEDFDFDLKVWLASQIKGHVHVPVIAVGGLDEDQKAEAAIEQGYADMAAIGRGFLADSQWGVKKQQEIKAESCRRCRPCRWFRMADNCPEPKKK